MPRISREISKYPVVPLMFTEDALAASQTDAQMAIINATGASSSDEYVFPFAGEVIGISVRTTAAATTGTATFGATINGTEDADTTITVATEQTKYKAVPRGSAKFAAGDRIGCELTTGGTWDGTSADAVVTVLVMLTLEGI